ncbi:MAG TPA: hypothetical protein VFA27_17535 [Vicinamibacterales bacterium]|nr:hypothetical protein [Vicinamibacterales bacterium]
MLKLLILCAFVAGTPLAASAESANAAANKTTRTPYQAFLAPVCLDGSNFCKFISDTVPDGASLEIQRVACQGYHVNTLAPTFSTIAGLRTADNTFVQQIDFLEVTSTPANGGSAWAISERTLMFIGGGYHLQISVNSGTTGIGSYGCTISGYLTTGR